MEIFKFYSFMFESDNANLDDMGCTWNAGHVICMISKRQTMDVRKACKMVMESEIVLNTTYKTCIKNFRIFDH